MKSIAKRQESRFSPFLLLSLLPAPAAAGPRLSFDDGRKSLEIVQAYQIWGAATLDPGNVPVPDPRADHVFQDGDPRSLFTRGPDARGEIRQRNDYLALGVLLSL